MKHMLKHYRIIKQTVFLFFAKTLTNGDGSLINVFAFQMPTIPNRSVDNFTHVIA